MDTAYLSALSALAGSAIGALSSFTTTWLTQHSTRRQDLREKDRARREALYGAFIDEASGLIADALMHEMRGTEQLVKLYSLVSRMRLFASDRVVERAEVFVERLVEIYRAPNRGPNDIAPAHFSEMDPLREFSETCRAELTGL